MPTHVSELLERFNYRDCDAFGEVYSLFFDELSYFATRLYHDTSCDVADAVQDAFIYIWQRSNLKFERVENIRSYLYIVLKNNFRNYISHQKHVDKYVTRHIREYDFSAEMIESRVYSLVRQTLSLLPDDCAEIFEFHINGWNAKEIADRFDISERTVFNKQAKAIEILRAKVSKEDLMMLMLL